MTVKALTLRRRKRSLTLPDRPISGGATAGNIGRNAIFLGFNPDGSLNPFVFMSYGLIGNLYESDSSLSVSSTTFLRGCWGCKLS